MKKCSISLCFLVSLVLFAVSCKKDAEVNKDTFKIENERVEASTQSVRIEGSYAYAGVIDAITLELGRQADLMDGDAYRTLIDGTNFSVEVKSLRTNTTYYYRYAVEYGGKQPYRTDIKTFNTLEYNLPEVKSREVVSVGVNRAEVSGEVISDGGGDAVTLRGICWGTSHNPSVGDEYANSGEGLGTFTCELTNLQPEKTYYARAFAGNSKGVAYGEELTLVTMAAGSLAEVSTRGITGNAMLQATVVGEVTNEGTSAVLERGVCYGKEHYPTTSGLHVSSGSGAGEYTCQLTNLEANATYYVRAYAINSLGIAYGEEMSFVAQTETTAPVVTTQMVSDITVSSATGHGTVVSDGGAMVTRRGLCWSTEHNPTADGTHADCGSGVGEFSGLMPHLTDMTTYYVRAYAENAVGMAYGEEVSFTVGQHDHPVPPAVTTAEVTNISATTAVGGGNVTNDGGAAVTERGICWSTTPNPTIGDSHASNGTGMGSYTCMMMGLAPGTTYFVRAYAKNSEGTAYGDQVEFTTIIMQFIVNVYANPSDGGNVYIGDTPGITQGTFTDGQSCMVTAVANMSDSFSESWDNGLNGWTNIDADGDGHIWYHSSEAGNHGTQAITSHSGSGHVMGESYCNYSSMLYPDDYLVSPQQYAIANGSTLTFWGCAQDASYPAEHFGVAISTGSNTNASDFTTIQEWTLTAKNMRNASIERRSRRTRQAGVWYQYTCDLSAYAGQQVWIAIRHFNCTDMFAICLDDISLTGGSYQFVNWTENGVLVSEDESYTFTVTEDRDLVANFTQQTPQYSISVSANPSNGGIVSGGGTYQEGQSCTVTATANDGYTFTNWTENDNVVSTNADYAFTVNGDRFLVANFTANSSPWSLLASFNAPEAAHYGVVSDGQYIYTSNWGYSSAAHNFYKYDMQGNMIEGFEIAGCGTLRGMTFDGQYVYGVANANTVYCVDLNNHTLISSFTTTYGAMRGITYDPQRDGFWVIGNWSGNLTLIDRTGAIVTVGPEPTSASDLAYYKDENNVEHVYCFNNSDNGVYDYNITTNTLGGSVFDFSLVPGFNAGTSGGCHVGEYNGKVAFFGDIQQDPNLIAIYELRVRGYKKNR